MAEVNLRTASDPEIMVALGGRLRALRQAAGLSMVAVAERTGLSRRTVARAEAGDNPTLATLIQLLRVLGRLGALESFIPRPEVSPLSLLAERKGEPDRG
ncbi:MAG: helix-turn-helix transcriptional regulator [Planctomycetes bacterium]|nr:helix-turn-helix transcriptional regulator [Planctomycetota bacterium]